MVQEILRTPVVVNALVYAPINEVILRTAGYSTWMEWMTVTVYGQVNHVQV